MSEYIWKDTYQDAVKRFGGETPGRDLEATLIEIFEDRPEHVRAAIDKLAARYADGKIRSPWGLILNELDNTERRHVVADSKTERANAIRLAETWIRNAGLYAPLTEAESELFDQGGRLHPWRDDQQIRDRIAGYWHDQQPRAEAAELERAERHARQAAAYHARSPANVHASSVPVTQTQRRQAAFLDTAPDTTDEPPIQELWQ